MANTKISNLTALGAAPATNDVLVVVDTSASETKKMTVLNLIAAVEGRANTFTALQIFSRLYTTRTTGIGNNSVWTMTPAATSFILLLGPFISSGTPYGIFAVRSGAVIEMVDTAGTMEVSTSVLTGTTGTSGRVTVSYNSSTLYIENRLGYGIDYTLLVVG
jgi:hypothetical protein